MAYGIRKVNEFIVKPGRALVLNGQDNISSTPWNSIADGTLYVNPGANNNFIKYKKTGSTANDWAKFKPAEIFDSLTIEGSLLANSAIIQSKMASNSVGTSQLIDSNVTSSKIASGAIMQKHFTENSINGKMFADNSIPVSKINGSFNVESLTGSISGTMITDGSIANGKLATSSVATSNLIDRCVTNAKLALSSVGTDNLIGESVTYAKLGKGCVKSDSIIAEAITNSHLGTSIIKNTNIDDNAISSSKIIGSVTDGVRTQGAVTNDKLSDNSVDSRTILNNAITRDKLSTDLQAKIDSITNVGDITGTSGDFQINGKLTVLGNITASPSNKTRIIEGFKVYNPVFADYAEGFIPEKNEELDEGDIVELNKYGLIRKASASSKKIVGVVSNQYGLCLGASENEIIKKIKVAVGLIGKVPINIIGEAAVGDMIVSAGEGIGVVAYDPKPYTVIGIALEDKMEKAIGKILCLIK